MTGEGNEFLSAHSPNVVTRQRTWNEIEPGCTPRLDSWRCSQNAIGFEVSTAAMMGNWDLTEAARSKLLA
jgi:hypothetical protein